MEFPRQEYWSGLPFPSPGDLPNPGIKPGPPALGVHNLSLWATRKVLSYCFLLYLKLHLWDSIHYWCTEAEPLASESPVIPILGLSTDLFSLMIPSVIRTKMLRYFTSDDEKWIINQSRKKQQFLLEPIWGLYLERQSFRKFWGLFCPLAVK